MGGPRLPARSDQFFPVIFKPENLVLGEGVVTCCLNGRTGQVVPHRAAYRAMGDNNGWC